VSDLSEVLFEYLSVELADVVSTRIYPGKLPEPVTFPAIAWHKIDARRDRSYEPFDEFDAFVFVRVQFDCWGRSYDEAADVGNALLGALSGYGGSMAGTLLTAHAINEFEDHDSLIKKYRRVLDFEVTYEESVKT
jgi:hypothetical protein